MIQRFSDSVTVRDDPEDYAEMLREAGYQVQAADLSPEAQEALRAALHAITNDPFNQGSGSVQTVKGKYHFKVRKTIFVSLIAVAAIGGSAMSGNPVAILAASLGAINQFAAQFTQLVPVEKMAYMAFAGASRKRKEEDKLPHAATETEAADWLRTEGLTAPPNFHDVVTGLAARGVLKQTHEDNQTRYAAT